MKKTLAASALVALLAMAPASAQILGGGLGGGLGGTLGGSIERTTGAIGSTAAGHGSVRGDKAVDTRSGHAKASGSADGSLSNTVDGMTGPVTASTAHSASGSANSGAEADLVGTDMIRSTATNGANSVRNSVGAVRETAGGEFGNGLGTANNQAGSALPTGDGSATGAASGSFLGSVGQLVAAGSSAASGSGMFSVAPGMEVADAKGRIIGEVVGLSRNARGVVRSVVVESGNKIATLPAANFAGSGNVLVSGMSKGEIKSAARDQQGQEQPQ